MNMDYEVGQFVGYVTIREQQAVPAAPAAWHVLQVAPGRDAKVIKAFGERCISGWSPTVAHAVSRGTGQPARKPHLGRLIVKPFLPGLIFLPDFEMDRLGEIRSIPDVDDLLEFGELRSWLNAEEMRLLRDIVAIENMLPSRRKWALVQLYLKYGWISAKDAEDETKLKVGRRIRIADGLFSGLRALIERIDSNGRLSVYVEDGKRGVKVSGLTETQIELID
ncbi:transcription termination/antitermination protein NusG [Bradyrhizobium sp. BR 1433]|uniref:transcription termination/antitermination protein NusG n=1 Tax=Bradyrhizobium sp. BR 1433 TaxID=3447967 RepID=UPI003EE7C7F2